MRIAIIGAGRIGGNVALQLGRAGHDVHVSFARDAAKLTRLAEETGATVASPAAAVAFAEVVVVSVPWGTIDQALAAAGSLEGKVVIDTTNQFGAGEKPAAGRTAAAFNAARMPGARYGRDRRRQRRPPRSRPRTTRRRRRPPSASPRTPRSTSRPPTSTQRGDGSVPC